MIEKVTSRSKRCFQQCLLKTTRLLVLLDHHAGDNMLATHAGCKGKFYDGEEEEAVRTDDWQGAPFCRCIHQLFEAGNLFCDQAPETKTKKGNEIGASSFFLSSFASKPKWQSNGTYEG